MRSVDHIHLLEYILELPVVLNYKLSLDKACTFVVDVIPWLNVKLVSIL